MYTIKIIGNTVPTNVGTWTAQTILGAKRLATKMAVEYGSTFVIIYDENDLVVSFKRNGKWINY